MQITMVTGISMELREEKMKTAGEKCALFCSHPEAAKFSWVFGIKMK